MLVKNVPHPACQQSLNNPCTLFAFVFHSNQILHSSRKSATFPGSFLSSSGFLTCCKANESRHITLQLFSFVQKGLLCCCSSCLECRFHTGTVEDIVQSSPTSFPFSGSSTPNRFGENFAGKQRNMSIVQVMAGQSLKPGLFFSAFRFGKFSRQWLRKGSASFSLRCEGAGALWNESWKVAFRGRPVDWLLGRHSAWLLFGICTCSIAAGTGTLFGPPALAERLIERNDADNGGSCGPAVTASAASHGKKVLNDYSVIGIPGDGRCLFRALAHGVHMQKAMGASSESQQRESADVLRGKVVDELVRRREETEWFIEGDFDSYTKRMRKPHVWGGEPELLMASHVLRMPITVYMFEQRARGLISIAEYGQEYLKENPSPIRVLYHGFGHYDALELPEKET